MTTIGVKRGQRSASRSNRTNTASRRITTPRPAAASQATEAATPHWRLKTMAEQKSLSGLTVEQAKEFHEQFKVTYTAFAGIAAVAHFLVIAWKPWF
jgi:light-harvesting complex 1 beta chain